MFVKIHKMLVNMDEVSHIWEDTLSSPTEPISHIVFEGGNYERMVLVSLRTINGILKKAGCMGRIDASSEINASYDPLVDTIHD